MDSFFEKGNKKIKLFCFLWDGRKKKEEGLSSSFFFFLFSLSFCFFPLFSSY